MKTFRKVQGMSVVAVAEGAVLGKLEDFQFDLENGRIFGVRIKAAGVFGRTGGVAADALLLFGRDLVLVRGEGSVDWAGEKRNPEDGRAWASAYRKTRVMTRRGASLGYVEDFIVEDRPPRVVGILLDGARMARLDARVAAGKDTVILDDPRVAVALPGEETETTDWWRRVKESVVVEEKRVDEKRAEEKKADEKKDEKKEEATPGAAGGGTR